MIRRERHALRQQLFDEIRALFEGGSSVGEIARKLGLGRRRVERWVRRIDLPDRSTIASTPSSPAYFGILLGRRWAEGITKVRHLFAEIHHRGYTGSFSHLARFLAPWRSGAPSLDDDEQEAPAPVPMRTLDSMTGRVISPLTAAALCVKPRGQMTARQAANVDALKAASAEFTTMRRLAMQFRGLLRGGTTERLDAWLTDARASGIYAMQRFAKTIRQDLAAARNVANDGENKLFELFAGGPSWQRDGVKAPRQLNVAVDGVSRLHDPEAYERKFQLVAEKAQGGQINPERVG